MRWSVVVRMAGVGLFILIGVGLTSCSSFAPTAWIGKNTPEDVGEGEFPKLSNVPARPELLESTEERSQIAKDLAGDRARVLQSAQTLLEDGEPDEDEGSEGEGNDNEQN